MERVKNMLSSNKSATFKPKKNFSKGTRRHELHKQAKATLGSGNLKSSVKLPQNENLEEWLAVNTVDFYNQINLLYASISDCCTDQSCPCMSAGPQYEYYWADGQVIKKPIKCTAPEYMNYLMDWIQGIIDDENIFPSRMDAPFPKNFVGIVKNIFKRLFRVYAHMYYSHFQNITAYGEEAHLNTCFKQFDLVDKRETAPLQDLIDNLANE